MFADTQTDGRLLMNNEFGAFITEKRKTANITLRRFAEMIGIAPAYLSDIEKGNRYPPDKAKLDSIAQALQLSQDETNHLYDLAAAERENGIAPDLPEYVMNTDKCRVALRMARDKGATNADWQKIINLLSKK